MSTLQALRAFHPRALGRFFRLAAIFLIVAGCIFVSRKYLSSSALEALFSQVNRLGHLGPVLLSAIYILACVLVFPASILTLAAGFLFGLWEGYLSVAVGSVLGASAAFWLGRTIGRDWVRRKVEGNPKFLAIDRAVTKSGFKIVILTRLSPVFPFNIQNFIYGATGVTFRDYFWASLIGMAPGTVMFVYLGSAMKSLAEVLSGKIQQGPAQQILFVVGLTATIAVSILATRLAAKALKESAGVENPNG